MKRPVMTRLLTSKLWLPLIAGGGLLLETTGCDPTVRTTILNGLQTSLVGLSTALINAFFMSLQSAANSSGSSTSQPVVQTVFDHLKIWLA